MEQQRKQIEGGGRDEQADSDEEIEKGMVEVKDKLAQQFDEKNSKKKKGKQPEEVLDQEEAEADGSDFERMSVDGSDATESVVGKAKNKAAALKQVVRGKGSKTALVRPLILLLLEPDLTCSPYLSSKKILMMMRISLRSQRPQRRRRHQKNRPQGPILLSASLLQASSSLREKVNHSLTSHPQDPNLAPQERRQNWVL